MPDIASSSLKPGLDMEQHELRAPDGGSIHCMSAGEGPTLLLAHGFLLDLSMYAAIVPTLVGAGYRVISFDQRGHGASREGSAGVSPESAADDYRVLLDHFGGDGATLVGHSMGGFLGLIFLLRHPEHARRLRRLVLLGSNAGAVAVGSLQNRLQMPLVESGIMPRLWRIPSVGRALMKPLFGTRCETRWLEETRQLIARQDVPRTLPLMRAMSHDNHYDRLRDIPVETRIVCGERDRTCPAWHSHRLGEEIPRATTRWLPGIGHMLNYEAPQAIVSAIVEP
jgi:non-heme chloroperoxidase